MSSLFVQINLTDMPQIVECCNDHDICYDTCKANRTVCDLEMKQCISNMCAGAAEKESTSDVRKIEEALKGTFLQFKLIG